MIFRQLFDPVSSTYTYLLGCDESHDAVVIDPVFEQFARDTALIRELGLNVRYVLDTHVHADHVTSAWLMRKSLKAEIVLSRRYGVAEVDVPVEHGDVLAFGNSSLMVLATPGHTNGCPSCQVNSNQDPGMLPDDQQHSGHQAAQSRDQGENSPPILKGDQAGGVKQVQVASQECDAQE